MRPALKFYDRLVSEGRGHGPAVTATVERFNIRRAQFEDHLRFRAEAENLVVPDCLTFT